jgi:putative PEP-CTERM system histidine kinase
LGLGFFYDFYLYADALLFKRIDPLIWESRGAINALIAPLVAVSVRRNPDWSLTVFVSKQVVFHTTGILGAGIYLLSMASIGYYIKYFGGEYGDFFRIVFFTSAIVMLFILISSGQFRAKLKVFLNKNFFQYQYDYRDEWLNLINSLSSFDDSKSLYQRVIIVMSSIMDSAHGSLWECRDEGCHCIAATTSKEMKIEPSQWRNTLAFLNNTNWIIDIDEYKSNRSVYENLQLPESVVQNDDTWLIVPLIHEEEVHSFVILSRSSSIKTLNWENRDLLMMAGRQAASYMVLEEAANALAEAQQFEGFNRLSAFVIHDLKNLIAQLSLVTSNAARHKHNPAFVDDAIVTIENSVGKMNRLMLQLKSAGINEKRQAVNIVTVVKEVINEKQRQLPKPRLLNLLTNSVPLKAETERLSAIIGHIIQNAQDATHDDGSIDVLIEESEIYLQLTVRDNGSGMDESFIQKRLFKPFDTTKGLTGMGIGAYECKEFIQSMNGEIEVQSEPGKGTDFVIRIPIDTEQHYHGEELG